MHALILIIIPILIIVCLLMVLVVLMQRPKQEGLGASFGAGVTDQIWGSQTTNVLQKFTVRLAILFFGLSLTLCILQARESKSALSVLEGLPTEKIVPQPPPTPATSPAVTTLPVKVETGAPATKEEGKVPDAPATPGTPVETPAPASEQPATEPTAPAEPAPAPSAEPAPAEPEPATPAPADPAPAAPDANK